jgi:hypothetical protein
MFVPQIGIDYTQDVLYYGSETVTQRGLKVGDSVLVGGSHSEGHGMIVGLSDEFPFKAQVKLPWGNGATTTVWIKSQYLQKLCNQEMAASYQEAKGFKVGQRVRIIHSFSKSEATVVDIDNTFPFRVQISLHRANSTIITSWVDSRTLSHIN